MAYTGIALIIICIFGLGVMMILNIGAPDGQTQEDKDKNF